MKPDEMKKHKLQSVAQYLENHPRVVILVLVILTPYIWLIVIPVKVASAIRKNAVSTARYWARDYIRFWRYLMMRIAA